MLGNKLINTNAGGGCTNTVDLYNPFPDGGGLALYQLNGNATDVSGNYDGTASNITWGGAGEFGTSAAFNGSSSGINTPIPFLNAKVTSSVSLWVKYTDTTAYKTLFQDWSSNNNWNHNIVANWPSTGNLRFFSAYGGSGGYVTFETSGLTLNDGNWHNIVGVLDVSTRVYKGYVDGVEVGSMTVSSNAWTGVTQNANIGNENGSANFFNGSIDQVRIFSRALRPYEVEALYTEEYCTPTIVPSEHFNTVTWSANGTSGDIDINGVGFQPDFVWAKARTQPYSNALFDSVRGVGSTHMLFSDSANSESTNTPNSSALGFVSSFNVDGFTGGAGTSGNAYYNETGQNYVAWNFKAGGAAVTNTDGTITSQVSANTEAGFSIVTATMGSTFPQTIGHGLGVAPNVILARRRSLSGNWVVYHKDVDATPENYTLFLDTTDAKVLTAFPWNNTAPTDSVFTTGQYFISNETIVAYCFAEVEGFSSFGSYVGNLSSQTNIVTGFEPAFVMIKCSSGFNSGRWNMYDNKRSTTNPNQKVLFADLAGTEGDNLVFGIDFYENGFSIPTTCTSNSVNQTGYTYIYMAFAADPTTVEPSLEDSFNTVTYTGNGGTQNIGGVFEGGGSFNGSSSYISIDSLAASISNNQPLTISGWFNGNTIDDNCIIELGEYTSGTFRIFFNASSKVSCQLGTSDSNVTTITSVSTFSTNTWNQFVLSFNGTSASLYVNGQFESAANCSYDIDTNRGYIGTSQYQNQSPVYYFNGSIDQVRIFNTALTAAQVTELYEETDADSSVCDFPSGAGAIALYQLNGNANDTCGTYNGTASNVTWLNNGVGFQPDLVWIKPRNANYGNIIYDSVRGTNKRLFTYTTIAEADDSPYALTSFNPNGFTVADISNGDYGVNGASGGTYAGNPANYVAWCWKGAELPAINSNGSIPSVVSANPAAGFSIVSYTTQSSGTATVGHGLNAEPNIVLVKTTGVADSWRMYHSSLGAGYQIYLNLTNAAGVTANQWNNTAPTLSVFSLGTDNAGSYTTIAYCFAEVAGFSKFGSYTGTGGSGNTVTLGFEPAFLLIKRTDVSGNSWIIGDNKRDTTNPIELFLAADTSQVEFPITNGIDFNANNFTIDSTNGSLNASGGTYIYMAFANQF